MTVLWHNQAHMQSVTRHRRVIVRGEGAHVFDAQGRRLLDVPAGLWFANIGHGRAEIARAVASQIAQLETYPIFGDVSNPRAEALAERIASMVPMDSPKVFFTSGGSDAVELAIKLVLRFWTILEHPERRLIVTMTGGYHGLHGFGTALVGVRAFKSGYGPLSPESIEVPWGDLESLENILEHHGSQVAALICEPILGGGAGVVPPPDGYLRGVQEACRHYDVLFVLDEVITGFGRAGAMFAADRYGVRPDILLLAKGITSGYLPLGAAVIGQRVSEPFWAKDSLHIFHHGLTYSGHATACAAALENLDILERENLVKRVRENETKLLDSLLPLRAHRQVKDVRGGAGLLAVVAFEDGNVAARVARASADFGMLMRVTGDNAIQVSPPFIICEEEIASISHAISKILSTL